MDSLVPNARSSKMRKSDRDLVLEDTNSGTADCRFGKSQNRDDSLASMLGPGIEKLC